MLLKNREAKGVSREKLAETLSIPVWIIEYFENPESSETKIIEILSSALDTTPRIFKGELPELPPKPKEPTKEEIKVAIVKKAKFPNIRKFLLDTERCENVEKAQELFMTEPLPLIEQNIILYLSTTALYHFCDTNSSDFAFDEYLFKLHTELFKKFKSQLQKTNLSPEAIQERLSVAESDIFACDTIENIAIRVVKDFAAELEDKLKDNIYDFEKDLELPFKWNIDEDLMRIEIKDQYDNVKDTIKLLDVKKKK